MKTGFWTQCVWSFGLVMTALWVAQACAVGAEPTAAELMLQGHQGRAVWTNFPGFTAKLEARTQGSTVVGQLQVSANGEVQLQVPEGADVAWVQRALDSLIGHRLSDSDVAQNVEFADDDTSHPFGRLIRSKDPVESSLWRVQGDVLTEVHRISEKSHFVISVADVARTPEGRHLPQNFTVETWERPSGRLVRSRQVHTKWQRIGQLDLPTTWWAVTNADSEGRRVEQLLLTDHQLLQSTAKAN